MEEFDRDAMDSSVDFSYCQDLLMGKFRRVYHSHSVYQVGFGNSVFNAAPRMSLKGGVYTVNSRFLLSFIASHVGNVTKRVCSSKLEASQEMLVGTFNRIRAWMFEPIQDVSCDRQLDNSLEDSKDG